jgi:integrase
VIPYSVFQPASRKFYQVQWTDPSTGRKRTKSLKTVRKKDAYDEAKDWIEKLERREGVIGDSTFEQFRTAHEEQVQPGMEAETARLYGTVFNWIEKEISPIRMSSITSRSISELTAKWRKKKLSEFTIRTYLVHLGKSLKWAIKLKHLEFAPEIELPSLPKKAERPKGRPITGEEFERLIDTLPKVIKASVKVQASWERLLRGLWLSGLRLDEALSLSWDDSESLCVDMQHPPMLLIPHDTDKSDKQRITPLTPDFAAFLNETPEKSRRGFVFQLLGERKGRSIVSNMQYVSAKISKIGRTAGVKVGRYSASGKIKYASAHDFRRSFGRRWASRVRNATDLQALMRHEDITTTLTYYALEDARDLADELWLGFANTSANTGHSVDPSKTVGNPRK